MNPTTPVPISSADITNALASIDWSVVCNMLSALGTVAAVFVAIYVYVADKRPDVVAYLDVDTDAGNLSFNVANYGNSTARNVRVEGFDSTFCQPEFRDKVLQTFISRGIPCLVPGGKRQTSLAGTNWASNKLKEAECTVTISYERRGLFGSLRKEEESFVLDYYSFANSVYTKSDSYLSRVALEKIAKKMD